MILKDIALIYFLLVAQFFLMPEGLEVRLPLIFRWPSSNVSNSQLDKFELQTAMSKFEQPVYKPPIKNSTAEKQLAIVTYVNGIYHSVDDWTRISKILENIFGCQVRPFYNPSSGWWVKDISRAGIDMLIQPALSKDLADHLQTALNDLHPDGRLLHIAHSAGAILTYFAAKNHLSAEDIARIDVLTFGAGRSITHKYFNGLVRNYYARNDPLTYIDPRARELSKNIPLDTVQFELFEPKHNTSFVFLTPFEGDSNLDHSLEYSTYRIALNMESHALSLRLLALKQRRNKPKSFARRIRKAAAKMSGSHHFWDKSIQRTCNSSTVRSIRKRSARLFGVRGFFSGKVK